ncbi:MAG: hypothetical protein LBS97_01700 [Treponema sp.]|jgi:hypothetical protein|nr:hypothetical protein [Treponema sp.]
MNKKTLWRMLGVLLAFSLSVAGCENTADPLSSSATLTSVKVAGVAAASLGTPSADWTAVTPGYVGLAANQLTSAPVAVTATEGSTVYYSAVASGVKPNFAAASTLTFEVGDSLYIEVFSANHDTVLFYQIAIIGNTVAESVTVAGVSATLAELGPNYERAGLGDVYLPEIALTGANVVVVTAPVGGTVGYANVLPGVIPDFAASATLNLKAEEILYIRLGEGGSYTYYAITVHSLTPLITDVVVDGRSASGGKELTGQPIAQEGTGVGTPGTTWNDTGIVAGSVWFGLSKLSTQVSVNVKPAIATTTFKIAVAADSVAPVFGNATTITPVDGQYLYIESKIGFPGQESTLYYKVLLDGKVDDGSLKSVKINNVEMTIGEASNHSFAGHESYSFMLTDSWIEAARLATDGNQSIYSGADLSNIIIEATPTVNGAPISFGHTANQYDGLVEYPNSDGQLGALANKEYIAVKVETELGVTNYYKFQVATGSADKEITSLKYGETSVTPGAGHYEWGIVLGAMNGADVGYFYAIAPETIPVLNIDPFDAGAAYLTVTASTGATVSYMTVANPSSIQMSGSMADNFTTTAVAGGQIPITKKPGTYLIQVVAENGATKTPYFVKVNPKLEPEDALLTSLALGGNAYIPNSGVTVTDLGTPGATAAVAVAGAVTLDAATAAGAAGFFSPDPEVAATVTVGSAADYRIAKTTGAAPADDAWIAGFEFYGYVFPPAYPAISTGDVLWVEVTAGDYTNIYKIVATVE